MWTYTLTAVENLIARYVEQQWEVYTLDEWVLWLWIVVCTWDKLKNCIIREKYVSPWASTHTIRFYRTLPKKYLDLISKL